MATNPAAANGQHGIRGVVRGRTFLRGTSELHDAGFVCLARGAKLKGYWWDNAQNAFPRDNFPIELSLEGGVISGVTIDAKKSKEERWTLQRLTVPRSDDGKLAAFKFRDSAAFERLTKLPVIDAQAAQAEGLSASVREVAAATATGLRGFTQPPGNVQGDITYVPPLALYSPYTPAR
jgi:hypothetical protein